MKFYLGTHCTEWQSRTYAPLFISARRLRIRNIVRAKAPWALDSGGFSEISLYGEWRTPADRYAEEVRLWSKKIGMMEWAAIQDWMCEPIMLAKTGLSIGEHQRRTIESYRDLLQLAPEQPWAPVLQGWKIEDYLDHYRQYQDAGFDLRRAAVVGVGSVCRRQATNEIRDLFLALRPLGLRLHGFGMKLEGLAKCHRLLSSADSMAWSFYARREPGPMFPECRHRKCASCLRWAIKWREKILATTMLDRMSARVV